MKVMNDDITRRLRFCAELPSLPAVAIKIIDLANDPDVDVIKISHYISLDPALSAKILKVANSPLVKSRRNCSNIRQAVCTLGTYAVISISLSFALASSLMKQPSHSRSTFDSMSFWRRSIASALACRALGEKKGLEIPDDLFLAGLLQDIGILAFSYIMPEEYDLVFSSAPDHNSLLIAEREAFGIGHDELGHALLKQWRVPGHISMACLASHNQPSPNNLGLTVFGCVAVSSYVADYFLTPKKAGAIDAATEAARIWLELDSAALTEVIDIMATELISVEELFEMTILHPTEISGILTSAKELLSLQRMAKENEIEKKSERDGLTGAYNRSYFDTFFEREFNLSTQHNLPLTLAMIDVDHFKEVNDSHGHLTGDSILIAIVKAAHTQLRQSDLLCRYGGEEFALILPGSSLASSAIVLSRLKDAIEKVSYKTETSNFVSVTVSIGVAANLNGKIHFENATDLIRAADSALYAAKKAGRNKIIEWDKPIQTNQQ